MLSCCSCCQSFVLCYQLINSLSLQAERPDAVRDFHAITHNPRSVMLEWRPPLKPGVSRYEVRWLRRFLSYRRRYFVSEKNDTQSVCISVLRRSDARRLQSIQNAATQLVTGTRQFDQISPVLSQLYWLPVWQRVEFKIATLVHQALCGHSPSFLAEDCCHVAPSLTQEDCARLTLTLLVSRMRTIFGDRALECSWTSCLERPANGPRTARLVIQPFQTVAEDIFIWSVGLKRSVDRLLDCVLEIHLLTY